MKLFAFDLFPHTERLVMRIKNFDFRLSIVEFIFSSNGFIDFLELEESTFFVSEVDNSFDNSKIFKYIIEHFIVIEQGY